MADQSPWDIATNAINGVVNTAGNVMSAGNGMIPAAVQAYKQWNDAGKYIDMGKEAADRADPFGQYRRGYGDKLQGLYDDPSAIANTPGYKFALDQALGATTSRLRAQGLLGSGQMQDALVNQASGMAQQTWNTEADRLARLAGAQFDPANAAKMQMQGGELAVNSQNQALDALFSPFRGNKTTINNNGGGGTNGGSGGFNPQNAASQLQRLASQAGPGGLGATAAQLFQKLLTSPGDMTQADINLMESLGIDTGVDTGGMNYAPGGYDSSGFGGYGTAAGDPTLTGINYGGDNFVGGGNDYGLGAYAPSDPTGDFAPTDPWSGGVDNNFDFTTTDYNDFYPSGD